MDNFFSEKTVQTIRRLNNKTIKSQPNEKWIHRFKIVKILLTHIIKRRMSINKILNKKDRNYVKSVLTNEVGFSSASEKFARRGTSTVFSLGDIFIEN